MTAYIELYVDQGSSFRNVIYLTDDTTNRTINVAGYSVDGQLRRSYYSQNASANITCTLGDTANGEIVLTMPPGETANLKPGRYLFDIRLTDSSNTVSFPLKGTIYIEAQVTK